MRERAATSQNRRKIPRFNDTERPIMHSRKGRGAKSGGLDNNIENET